MKPKHLLGKQYHLETYSETYAIDEDSVICEVVEATFDEDGAKLTDRKLSDGVPTFEQYLEFVVPTLDNTSLDAYIRSVTVPKKVTMRQARLALLKAGLLAAVEGAINGGNDEAMKIEWEYATEIEREWTSLIALTESMGMTSDELDDLFIMAGGL